MFCIVLGLVRSCCVLSGGGVRFEVSCIVLLSIADVRVFCTWYIPTNTQVPPRSTVDFGGEGKGVSA